MAELRWTPQAADDLEVATEFIARDSPRYASLFAMSVIQAVEQLEHFPASGRIVPEKNDPSIRELIHRGYRIIYRLRDQTVELLAIHHASRPLDLIGG